jgi:hypothetical protein
MARPSLDLDAVAKDIRAVSTACRSRYAYRHATIRVIGAATALTREADPMALDLCLDWLLDQAPASIVRGYLAAERLDGMRAMVARHAHELTARLRKAA